MNNIDNNKYNIVTLCGSMKFKNEFMKTRDKLVLYGNIVFTPTFLQCKYGNKF